MNEMTRKVFETIDQLADQYLQVLVDCCNIESKSEDKEGVDRVGAYFAAIAEEKGYTIRKREFEKAGNVYSFTYNPDGAKKLISLSGHMDTVHEKGIFGYPPVRIQGDYVYGPGVIDCKGGIVLDLLVMEALKKCGYKDRPVKLILQSDEEVDSCLSDYASVAFMVEEARGSAAFINGEKLRENRCLAIGRKGIVRHKITITGKKCHAGYCTNGASALKEAAYKIIELEKDNDVDSITFNCGVLNCAGTINIVPDRCELFVEYRFKNMEQKKQADEKFKRIVETSYVAGTCSTAEMISKRLPMEPDEKNKKLVQTINEICESVGLEPFDACETAGGADSAYPSLAGIPTVDAMGLDGMDLHTANERARISSLREMAKVIAATIIHFPE